MREVLEKLKNFVKSGFSIAIKKNQPEQIKKLKEISLLLRIDEASIDKLIGILVN
jgi:hypothetical protein